MQFVCDNHVGYLHTHSADIYAKIEEIFNQKTHKTKQRILFGTLKPLDTDAEKNSTRYISGEINVEKEGRALYTDSIPWQSR